MDDLDVNLALKLSSINLILLGLGELPAKQSMGLIQQLRDAGNAVIAAASAPPMVDARDPPPVTPKSAA